MSKKAHHRRSQLLAYIWEHGPVTRREISKSLDINLPAISKSTAELLKARHIMETGQEDSTGGRKAQLLDVPGYAGTVLAVNFSSMGIIGAISDMKAQLSHKKMLAFDTSMSTDQVLKLLEDIIQDQIDFVKTHNLPAVQGIGVVISGIVDEKNGISISFPRFDQWQNVPLRNILSDRFSLPVSLGHRICAITLAEIIFGKNKHHDDFLYLHLGPGIGLGICIGGKIYRGAQFPAGELGHVTVEENGQLCYCGNYGCLETVASDAALVNEARSGMKDGVESRISEFSNPNSEISIQSIFKAAEAGDRFAGHLVENIGQALGISIANVINLFGPKCLVIGGTMSVDVLNTIIARTLKRRALERFEKSLEIVRGSFGADEGIKGAAAVALRNHYKQ